MYEGNFLKVLRPVFKGNLHKNSLKFYSHTTNSHIILRLIKQMQSPPVWLSQPDLRLSDLSSQTSFLFHH